MAKNDLIHKGDLAFGTQTDAFKNSIAPYAALLGLTAAQVTAQAADADHYNYVLQCQQFTLATAKAWTAERKSIRRGKSLVVGDNALANATLPAPVPPVAPGVERRFRALLRQVKSSGNYHRGIGLELGIEAVDHAAPDFTTLAPRLKLSISGDHVRVGWSWQGRRAFLDLCEIQVDRGDGHGFVPLTYTLKPGYKDPTPFPATPARWQYRAAYRVADAQVGQWSQVSSITVPA